MAPPFVFFDLRTTDVAAARQFYTSLFGWSVQDVPAGEEPVPMFVNDNGPWGGFSALGEDDERKPQWVPYVPVVDLAAAADRATSLGGSLVRGPIELPVGSLVVIADPSGAPLVLWQARGA